MNKDIGVEKAKLPVLERLIWHAKNERHLFRWIVSRLLYYSGAGSLFVKDCGLYRIRFFKSSLSLMKWQVPGYGEDVETVLRGLLRSGDMAIDVGANIGTITLALASKVGPEGLVVAYEPNPRIFRFLERNVRLNAFSNVRLINAAVGDRQDYVFFSNDKNDDQNRIVNHGKKAVQMVTLDESLSAFKGRIRLLKVDVEGYERNVFQGAADTLTRTDYIFFEVFDEHFAPFGYTTKDLLKLIDSCGFDITRGKSILNNEDADAQQPGKRCMDMLAKKRGVD